MKVADGFAGAGGFRIALEKSGHKCVWSCEVDNYARQVYRYHWKEPIAGDIRKVDPKGIPDIDLFVAGFPCQAFSIAGKREGFTDTRGTLFFEICRILRVKRPKMVLLENVKGLLSHDNYRTFRIILESLRELGYMGQYQVLNSKNFGVPQNRERVFIVGYLGKGPGPEVFPIGESYETFKKNRQHKMISNGEGHAYSLDCNYQKGGSKSRRTMIQVGNIDTKDHNSLWGRVYDPDGISSNINAHGGGLGAKTGLYRVHNLQQRSPKRPSLNNNPNAGGQGHISKDDGYTYCLEQSGKQAIEGKEIRRLTPLECERLQGFPDNWTKYGITAKGEKVDISDTQRYKMMGNAVTVPVVEAIAKKF